MSKTEIIQHLEEVRFVGAGYSDFYGMPMFKYKEWYLEALKENGLMDSTYWKTFVDEKIEGLEKWIEENRPKLA